MKPKMLHALGMQPWTPRWVKVWCLKIIIRDVSKKMELTVKSLTPEQRAKYEQACAKHGKMEA